MIKKLYYWLHAKVARPEERGEYSAGYWQDIVRTKALEACDIGNGNVLEAGCGEGLFLAKLAKAKPSLNIYGVDIWKEILDKAAKRMQENNITNVQLSHNPAGDMPYEDRFFDVVACINVFFNLPSDDVFQDILKEISRVSKPGGKFIFDVRNSLNPLLFVKYKLAKYYDETVKDLPLRTYDIKKVVASLEKNGFEITHKIPISFPRNCFSPVFVFEATRK